jgi:hypothetical protein
MMPLNVFAPGNFNINKRKIVSVYPGALSFTIRAVPIGTSGASTTFVLPPAPTDSYVEIEVQDMQSWFRNWEAESMQPLPIHADAIASELVSAWTSGLLGTDRGGRPGIAVRDQRPVEDQVADLQATQQLWANTLVDEAQAYFNDHDFKKIGEMHRLAARWLGIDVPWIVDLRKQKEASKRCPACGEEILAAALKCNKCQQNLIEWYREYDPEAADDPVVKARLEKIPKAAKTAPVTAPEPPKPEPPKAPAVAPPLSPRGR